MSSIALVVEQLGLSRGKTIAAIRGLTGLPLSEIVVCLGTGRPIFEGRLYHRDHPEVARELVALMDALRKEGAEYALFQLAEGKSLAPGSQNRCRADEEVVRRRLRAHESELRRQDEQAFREAASHDTGEES